MLKQSVLVITTIVNKSKMINLKLYPSSGWGAKVISASSELHVHDMIEQHVNNLQE